VPAGVQTGKQLRLRGKGMPALRSAGAGDLYIELQVETPVNLSTRQRELLEEFEKAGKNNSPATQDFFSRVKGFWDGMTG
jgi:molecular chaperone DnaJ